MTKQRGQYLLEFLVCVKAVFLLISLTSILLYLFYSKQVASHFMYKGLFCLESINKTTYQCKRDIKTSIKPLLFFHKNLRIHIISHRGQHQIRTTADFINSKSIWTKKMSVY